MATQIPTPGRCRICDEPVTKRTIAKHTSKNHADNSGKERFVIIIDTPYSSPYWLAVTADPGATLLDLDQFIRDVWVECCGHMSAFTIGGVEYGADYEGGGFDYGRRSKNMKVSLRKVITKGVSFSYEYDFGSTTSLRLKVVDQISSPQTLRTIALVGMNEKPTLFCSHCDKEAHYHYCEDDTLLCRDCAQEDGVDEDYFLPIVNSPRSGVCGYEGGRYDEPNTEAEDNDEDHHFST